MKHPNQTTPSHPIPRILAFALADLFGLFCLFIGTAGVLGKPGMIIANFPRSTAEAWTCAAGGIVVMLWAMSRLLRDIRQLRRQD